MVAGDASVTTWSPGFLRNQRSGQCDDFVFGDFHFPFRSTAAPTYPHPVSTIIPNSARSKNQHTDGMQGIPVFRLGDDWGTVRPV